MLKASLIAAGLCAASMVLVVSAGGCAGTETVLLSGANPARQMYHVDVVADPYAVAADRKVLRGGPLGPKEPYANKATFIDGQGFFVMPESGRAELRVRVAMEKVLALKIEITARPKGSQKFNTTLETDGAWQEVVIPLDPARLPPGATVHDITVFQVGKDPAARLHVESVRLVTR